MRRIRAREFFEQYKTLFDRRRAADPARLLARFCDRRSWTDFMLNDTPLAFLPEVVEAVGNGCLEYRREFKLADLCAWEKVDDPYHKPQYNQPLYIHIVIEHEIAPTPEEEFWKLLHWYSPLMVHVCYSSRPAEWLKYFEQVRAKVSTYHPRSTDEEYLVIIGPHRDTVF